MKALQAPIALCTLGFLLVLTGHSPAQKKVASRSSGFVAIRLGDLKPGQYPMLLTIGADGSASMVPLPVVSLDGTPSGPGNPPVIPSPTSLSKAVVAATKKVNDPKKDDNVIGLAVLYSVVSSRVASGGIKPSDTPTEIKKVVDAYVKEQGVEAEWKQWRKDVGAALVAEQNAGRLTTKEQVATALKTVATAMTNSGMRLAKNDPVARALEDGDVAMAVRLLKGRFLKVLQVVLKVLPLILNGGDIDIADLIGIISELLGQRTG